MPNIVNGEGNFFVQEEAGVDEFEWLTCTGVGDIEIPEGDRTPEYCPDPLNSGQFRIEGYTQGDAGVGTYELTKPLALVWNYLLEQMNCEMQGRINWTARGVREDHRNYELAVVMLQSVFQSRRIVNPVRGPGAADARVDTNGRMAFANAAMLYPLEWDQHSLSNTVAANSIYFLPRRCADRVGSRRDILEIGVMGMDRGAGYLYDSEVKITIDGDTWTAAAVDPFSYGGNIFTHLVLETRDGERILVFRGEPVAGAPVEAAYSEDRGATWTNIFMGTLLNQGANGSCLSGARVLVCCTDGYIYSSTTQGATWTTVEAGVETAQDLNDIASDPVDPSRVYCVGNSNAFLFSVNGGQTWSSRTGPAVGTNLLSVAVNQEQYVFVTTNDARMFRSRDRGQTWTEVLDLAVGTIDMIRFDMAYNYFGGIIHNNASPLGRLLRSENGGASWWEVEDLPTNSGLNALFMGDQNYIAVCGETQGGTTFVAETYPI